MNNDDIKELCISLAKAEDEESVVKILKNTGFWDDSNAWIDYDRNPNNFSTIGNQQSSPDAALVEKIINSVDAVLMRECQRLGIKPDSDNAPKSIQEALEKYFNIREGKLSNVDARQRTKLAKNILLVATGRKSNPCYSIIDFGEGQTPKKMQETFLSLNKKNKLNIHFVQGKFNMGGTGALQFCSRKYNLQLIISKRDPLIAKYEDDETKDKWGFTIIRREDPKGGMKSSSFRYLAPAGEILMFNADYLPLLPGEYSEPYSEKFEYGTFIKLYEYQLKGYKTIIKLDLYYRLSLLLPNIALPITMYECRGYDSASDYIVMSGLSVRLDEDKSDNLEPGFPSSCEMEVEGEKMKVLIYAFKQGKREKYARNEGIIFLVNGQAHGFLPQTFFERKSVGMSYISDSILVLVDCSKFNRRTQEDLFMNSRDRLRDTPIRDKIIEQLEDLIKNHEGLRALREKRRKEEMENKLSDSKPLKEVLEKIIKKHPSLSKFLIEGGKISNPFNLDNCKTKEEFAGKRFPTYFKLTKDYEKDNPKIAYKNKRFRIQFETDAENDYFDRDNEPGQFSIYCENHEIKNYTLNLWNGLATLTVELPENANIDDILYFKTETIDDSRVEPFINEFFVKIKEQEIQSNGEQGKRKSPPGEKGLGKSRKIPSGLSLPNIQGLKKKDENWSKHFNDDEDALDIKDSGEGYYDFYINLDNKFLLHEIKNNKNDPSYLEKRFEIGITLIGMSLLNFLEEQQNKSNDNQTNETSIYKHISKISRAIAPVFLPMIDTLADLKTD